MITDSLMTILIDLLRGISLSLLNMMPGPPSWVITPVQTLGDLNSILYSFSAWIPVSLAYLVAGAVIAAFLLANLLQMIKVFVSYITFGGGAT